MRTDAEQNILATALDALKTETGIETVAEPTSGTESHDARIKIRQGDIELVFAVEIKKMLNRTIAAMAPLQMARFDLEGILVTRFVNPRLADLLRELGVQFIDGAGVAIGTIVTVMKDLKILNFLQEKGKGNRHLVRTTDLLNRWVAAYPEKLRPGLLKGRYTAKDPLWWQKPELEDARLGGEAAAAFLTGRLKPAGATLYAKTNLGRLVVKNRFTADNDGTIDILKRFWNFEYDWPHRELAPPLLIYADLLATGDARAIETAKVIYDRFLAGSIGQD